VESLLSLRVSPASARGCFLKVGDWFSTYKTEEKYTSSVTVYIANFACVAVSISIDPGNGNCNYSKTEIFKFASC